MSGSFEPFTLTDHDKSQSLWRRLVEHLNERLEIARKRNDNPELGADATASLRGEIRCLKGLIALGNDRPMTGNDEQPPV